MRRPVQHRGYFQSGRVECDVVGCSHCSGSIVIKPGEWNRVGRCGACDRSICPACEKALAVTLKCRVWEARMEKMERKAAFLKATGV